MESIFRMLLVPWLLIQLTKGSHVVQIVEFNVPDQVERGKDVTLVCSYDLGQNRLYSVKWTKGNYDFYTYTYVTPTTGNKDSYSVPGINVDSEASTDRTVVLRNVQLGATGMIKCEVTAEKTFETDNREQYMTVSDIPDESPVLSRNSGSLQRYYRTGERIGLKCESAPSYPAANISWTINGKTVGRPTVNPDPVRKLNRGPDTLEISAASLSFTVEERHFANSKIHVVCMAKIGSLYEKSADHFAYKEGYPPPSMQSSKSSRAAISVSLMMLRLLPQFLVN